ncbi:MAG: hypothetical protein HZB68_03110 [Candidatus Aenigmarchaeota archaeon]|nr:hypothetical protein [Candidatus Aenigmarchaeota archaeon]
MNGNIRKLAKEHGDGVTYLEKDSPFLEDATEIYKNINEKAGKNGGMYNYKPGGDKHVSTRANALMGVFSSMLGFHDDAEKIYSRLKELKGKEDLYREFYPSKEYLANEHHRTSVSASVALLGIKLGKGDGLYDSIIGESWNGEYCNETYTKDWLSGFMDSPLMGNAFMGILSSLFNDSKATKFEKCVESNESLKVIDDFAKAVFYQFNGDDRKAETFYNAGIEFQDPMGNHFTEEEALKGIYFCLKAGRSFK